MKLKYSYLFCIIMAVSTFNTVFAEDLIEIYQLALENDSILNSATSRNLANQEKETQVKSLLIPSFTLNASLLDLESFDPNRPRNYSTGSLDPDIISSETVTTSNGWAIITNQVLFDWSKIHQLRQAEKIVALGDLSLSIAYQDLILRVIDTYFSLITAEQNLIFFESRLARTSEQLDQAKKRFDLGAIPITDLQAIQSQYDLALSTIISAQRLVVTNEDRLAEIIGTRIGNLSLLNDDFNFSLPEPNDINHWIEQGLSSSLELNASILQSEIAYDSYLAIKASRLPTLNFSAALSNTDSTVTRTNELMNNPPCLDSPPCPSLYLDSTSSAEDLRYSINLSLPIFSGGLLSSRLRQSSFEYDAANHDVTRQYRALERSIRDAFLGVQLGVSQINAYTQAVRSSETSLGSTERAYELGSRTTSDILIAQENLINAQVNLENVKKEYLKNTFNLKALTGALNADDLVALNNELN
jgi:outer membrane protein